MLTLSKKNLSIKTLRITTLKIATLTITTLRITVLNIRMFIIITLSMKTHIILTQHKTLSTKTLIIKISASQPSE
jgi:hypothetical protein